MLETDFFIISAQRQAPFCFLAKNLKDAPTLEPRQGDAVASRWPTDAAFRMSDANPGIVVPDFIHNSFRLLFVSSGVKDYFSDKLKEPIEFLPFHAVNHKGDELDSTSFVVNVLGLVDCLDRQRSVGDEDALNPGWYEYFEELHLDVGKIPADRRIFRLASFPSLILVRKDVKEEIEALKFTAVRFTAMGGAAE